MNVRVPADLRDAIDSRRGPLQLSRDEWVTRALRWALQQQTPPRAGRQLARTVAHTQAGRTIDTTNPRSRL